MANCFPLDYNKPLGCKKARASPLATANRHCASEQCKHVLEGFGPTAQLLLRHGQTRGISVDWRRLDRGSSHAAHHHHRHHRLPDDRRFQTRSFLASNDELFHPGNDLRIQWSISPHQHAIREDSAEPTNKVTAPKEHYDQAPNPSRHTSPRALSWLKAQHRGNTYSTLPTHTAANARG